MPTTLQSSFAKFIDNLTITDLQDDTVRLRQKNVREVMQQNLKVLDSFVTGSYLRGTMIAPLSDADVDVFIVLDSSYYYNYNNNQNGGQGGLLDLVKRNLQRTYPRTPDISRDGQAVTVRFSDFVVDVVPAFNRQGGGYLIPNSISKTWISTNPQNHVELIITANKNHNYNLVPLIKMIKSWNKSNDKYFQSFHLEVLALQIFSNIHISDYPSGIRYFFGKATELISQKNLDPAGYGGDIGAYINTPQKIQEAISKFQRAYEQSLKAENYARQGQLIQAVETWIKLFDNYFPAYG